MAVSIELTSNSAALTNVTGANVTHSVTAATKIIGMFCTASANLTDRSPGAVTYAGAALAVAVSKDDANFEHCEIWFKDSPAAGTNTCTFSIVSGNVCAQLAVGCTGLLNAATGAGNIATATGSTDNPSLTCSSSAGEIIISILSSDVGPNSTTTQGGSLLWEQEDIASDSDFNAQQQTASGATTVCSWTSGAGLGDIWAAAAMSIGTSGAVAGDTSTPMLNMVF